MMHIREKEHQNKTNQIVNNYDKQSKRLDANRQDINDAVMIYLADRFQHWNTIRSLNLTENDVSENGLKVLISKPMSSLLQLYLSNNLISNAAMCIIIKVEMPNLRTFQLDRNFIGNTGLKNMTKGKWPSLSSLKLSDNNISACGVDYIALGNWKNLNYIYLDRNKFLLSSLMQVRACCKWNKLKRLVLYTNDTMNFLSQNRVRQLNANWVKIMIYILPTNWQIEI